MKEAVELNSYDFSKVVGKKGIRIDGIIRIGPNKSLTPGKYKCTILTKDKDIILNDESNEGWYGFRVISLLKDSLEFEWKVCKNGWLFTKLLNCRIFIMKL